MTDRKREALDYIIENKQIKTVFQPIISLRDGSILGHEALSRITCESEINSLDMLFACAEKYNRIWDLEQVCRTKSLEMAFDFMIPRYSNKLFLNVNPKIIHDDKFKKGFTKSFLLHYKISPSNVIFEITEKSVITDITSFRLSVEHYKGQDYKIAIDDAGAGYSGLNLISDLHPNYIKLDMNLIRNINLDSQKYALVKGMVEFSKVSKTYLIAEGIETYEELETLINLGIHYGQGYYIQNPKEEIEEISIDLLYQIKNINNKKNYTSQNMIANIYIENLCSKIDTICPEKKIIDVYDMFKKNTDCYGLCIIDQEKPIGIITREKLTLKLSGHYGFSLYQNKKIPQIMDNDFLSVEYTTPVNIVSSMAMSRKYDKLYDFIVVTKKGKYIGVVTIKDLLQKTTEIEISVAKHQNPLTGLPGNLLIEQKLNKCILENSNYTIAYLDLNNFKAYNDVYGFEKGDLVIKLFASLLRSSIPQEQFIGHIGGDDFIVILNHIVSENYFNNIKKEFENKILNFYQKADLKKKYISTFNRHGNAENYPLMTFTCVLLTNNTQRFKNVLELTEKLAELKKMAKQDSLNIKNSFESL
ncbi:GGDEF domain-containing protein [Anaerovorax sp. IOR16]|uniref:GGDEF domain-containing protein n=1 Tax=Anaerovorax sp. IOR16 TaxID=2773458 RepID=UPI0019D29AB1|nr:bifunctional diguanylate cyclase/phosphodiesterase [Anaerovorax sp. IOR16]